MRKPFLFLFCMVAVSLASVIPDVIRQRGLNNPGTRFSDLPLPEDLVFDLSEDEYEDYLAYWLNAQYTEEYAELNRNSPTARAGCSVGVSMAEPTPVYERGGKLIVSAGTSGSVNFNAGEQVTGYCAGSGNGLTHASGTSKPASAVMACQSGTSFTGSWVSSAVNLGQVKCVSHPVSVETKSGSCGGGGTLIQVGVQGAQVRNIFKSCFHEGRAEAMYTQYTQTPENKVTQSTNRPSFSQGAFFPGLTVDSLYSQNSQKQAISTILGSSAMADKYINSTFFMARGHLAAMSDFVFAYEERATFTFINVVPQWQPFNGGNWNTLEQRLRSHIGNSGYRTEVYTGGWGTMTLKDGSGNAKPIYLSRANNKIPVPLWLYKVVRDVSSNKATAFIGLNNPHLTLSEAKALAFCPDKCAGNSDFSWLGWKNDDMRLGFSICCDVNDFKKVVNVLPSFSVSGLFS